MKPEDPADPPSITLRPHPPERRLIRALARGEVVAQGMCCCCCCCLHSIGSLAGAMVGSFHPRDTPVPSPTEPTAKLPDDELDGPASVEPVKSPVPSIYWMVTLGASVLVSMYAVAQGAAGIRGALGVLVVVMPAIQLGASLLCLFVLGAIPALDRDTRTWKRLGWITLGTVIGGAVGFLAMYIFWKTR